MKSFYTKPLAIQWLVAILLVVVLHAAAIAAAIGTRTMLHLPMRGSGPLLVLAIVVGLPFPVWMAMASVFASPLLRLAGILKYYSPLFLTTGSTKTGLYLHGGTLFDYIIRFRWRDRGALARRKTLAWYVEGLLAIVHEIEKGNLPKNLKMSGTSYFFSARRARGFGFTVESSWRFALGGILTYPAQFLTYSFARGRLSFPTIFPSKKASILGAELLRQKAKLELVLERLRDGLPPALTNAE